MYTPAEVQDKKFPKAVFGGYDMGEVDDFLDALSSDYQALYKENAVLKSKLKVLAEKVEEYRGVDAAMRKALIVAQKMASEMTEEAKVKSEEIKNKARIDYENSVSALKDDIRNEERRLDSIKDETKQFVEASILICQRQIDNLKRMISDPGDAHSDPEQRAEEIENSISRAINEETSAVGTTIDLSSPDALRSNSVAQSDRYTRDDEAMQSVELSESEDDSSEDQSEPQTSASMRAEPAYGKQNTPMSDKPQEVNVGGMNIRVFEMDLGGDRPK